MLDACSSGAFTRVKGGRPRPAFLVDESSDMRGHAFLTSSAESEAAQESDRIRASYFTHFLISGFRGAADLSGDGKVTLNEAYQFAFNETLGRTVDTKGGAQHPSYDINLSGTGDVVMTDVRQTTATLVLGEELEGRFFIRTARRSSSSSCTNRAGGKVELGDRAGDRTKSASSATKGRWSLARRSPTARAWCWTRSSSASRRRGSRRAARARVRASRFEGETGSKCAAGCGARATTARPSSPAPRGSTRSADSATRGYVRENLAVVLSVDGFGIDSGATVGPNGTGAGNVGGSSVSLGVRWNPLRGDLRSQALKPFLAVSLGPVIGASAGSFVGKTISTGEEVHATIGGFFGGGFDVHVSRSFSLGVNAGYNVMQNFSEPVGLRDNFNGPQVGIGLGWVFGKGY